MFRLWIDIPPEAMEEYRAALSEKQGVCLYDPEGRFYVGDNGHVGFEGLVCRDKRLRGQNTGTSAKYCKNCALEGRTGGGKR